MKLLDSMMSSFVKVGQLTIIDVDGNKHVYGPGGVDSPSAVIRLTNEKLYRNLFLNPELKAGEAYMDGTLICEQGGIRGLLEVFANNRGRLRSQPTQKILRRWFKKIRRFHQLNKTSVSRKNVKHHYDLSNEFYRLFLDDDLNYSCAYYQHSDMTLEQAQLAKKRHIASKLQLTPGVTVLDIGCGWGAMAIYLAEQFDCHVVGVTLSDEQYELATKRIKDRGLSEKVEIKLMDYRDVTQKFDRVVSIGMFEHVGLNHYLEYFKSIKALLNDSGCAVIHSIGRKGGPGSTGAWIRKYIFPGGYSPALSETFEQIEKSGLWVTDCEILRLHYAETLLEWDKRFQANRDKVASMFDQRFCRMWEFYLIISEFSFRYGKHMNFQIQLSKNVDDIPITRDYMRFVEMENE
ncbi:MAG: cyclopropane-fatty-acyl-phospholipid synthase family protein [Gammaproteobacteria bacterium]|nr:cyclopropane-fatty-acyl-phospholipid synthase family protein [Gammaproteobacteria bacterium]